MSIVVSYFCAVPNSCAIPEVFPQAVLVPSLKNILLWAVFIHFEMRTTHIYFRALFTVTRSAKYFLLKRLWIYIYFCCDHQVRFLLHSSFLLANLARRKCRRKSILTAAIFHCVKYDGNCLWDMLHSFLRAPISTTPNCGKMFASKSGQTDTWWFRGGRKITRELFTKRRLPLTQTLVFSHIMNAQEEKNNKICFLWQPR